jgi:hypothetical protein
MSYLRVVALAAAALVAARPAAAQPARPAVTDVTHHFPPGPYTTIATAAGDPARMAVGTDSGVVAWTEDGGAQVGSAEALHFRKMDPVTLRNQTSGFGALTMRGGAAVNLPVAKGGVDPAEGGEDDEVRGMHLFLDLLNIGVPGVRYYLWMTVIDPVPTVLGVAVPNDGGPMALAGPHGVYVSDRTRGSWMKAIGAPGIMPHERDPSGVSVGIDPRDGKHILAATDRGLNVSRDGGNVFLPHPDANLENIWISRIAWDPANPDLVFLVTPDQIYLSQDSGRTFEPSFSAAGEIRDLALSPDAAIVATSEGLYLAYADRLDRALEGKDLIGAVPWRDGAVLAATADELFLVQPGGAAQRLLTTSSRDPFLRMAGGGELAWLLRKDGILRLGDPLRRDRRGGKAPRLLLSAGQIERAVLEHTGLGGPLDTRMHERWYAKLVPQVELKAEGKLGYEGSVVLDGTLPVRERYIKGSGHGRTEWSVWASWDLSDFVFGDSNAANPNLMIETNLREKRKELLARIHQSYREAAALARSLERPPADDEAALLARLRLAELNAYLEFMSGRPIVGDLDLE